ncbi:sodium/proline symporter [[Clostridium] polysaccharolyticum]|uniref:Sodium/proline symporter n=2 Tax=[Clostridium] polysaccharolyticum TaxID=29364 RepID=A0A1I0BAN5_9FIRM|nr:sodium/proline symporter PutP [[Clostridium] polysaccharolyticum]SET03878.1 sodium/proline symporter [[Clostridium] polysaccharolyticum]
MLVLLAMAAYMLIVLAVGFYYGKRNKTSDDYFIGGRKLGAWVTAMSAEASDMSSWLLMGLPGLAYLTGFGEAGWTAIGLAIGTYLNWKFVAKRLRKYTEVSNNSITLPDFFSNRFRDKNNILMIISSILIIIFFTVYTASGFSACGKLFASIFDFKYVPTMIICGFIIVLYTSAGGFMAASTTDLIQGLLMSFAIIIVLIIGIVKAGGIGEVLSYAKSVDGYMSLFSTYDPAAGKAASYGVINMISGLAWGLGYFGVPHILLRFMAIKSSKEIKKSRTIAMTWVIISLAVAVCIGYVGAAITAKGIGGIETLTTSSAAETIFIRLTNAFLPKFIAGIVLSGILAATMSTADSQLLLVSSSVGNNLYKKIFQKEATDRQILLVTKTTTFIVAIVAMIIALNPDSSIFNLVSLAWSGFGSAFGPLILFALFWKRTTLKGAVAGMLGGGTLSVAWSLYICKLGGILEVYSLLPAFIFASLLIVIVSLLDKEPSSEIQSEFDSVETTEI